MIVYYTLVDIGNSGYYLVVSDKKYRYKELINYTTQKVIHLNMVEKLLDYNICAVTFDEENQLMKTISNNNINTLLSQIKLKINETRRILTQYEQNL